MVLICISLMPRDVEHFFCVCWPLYVFFGEMSAHVFCPFLDWIIHSLGVEFDRFFIDFDTSPLSDKTFANTFSPILSVIFWFCRLFPWLSKVFYLDEFPIVNFAFVSLAFGDMFSKKLMWLRSEWLLPVFSSRILMVSCLTFRSSSILSLFLCMV